MFCFFSLIARNLQCYECNETDFTCLTISTVPLTICSIEVTQCGTLVERKGM